MVDRGVYGVSSCDGEVEDRGERGKEKRRKKNELRFFTKQVFTLVRVNRHCYSGGNTQRKSDKLVHTYCAVFRSFVAGDCVVWSEKAEFGVAVPTVTIPPILG